MLQLQAISSRSLSNALSLASKCCVKKNAMAILDNVLLSQNGDKLMFTTATAESQLTIPAPLTIIRGEMTTPLALPITGIDAFLSILPECVVNMTFNDDLSLVLDYCVGSGEKVKTGKVSLTYLDGSEFPLLPAMNEIVARVSVPMNIFSLAVEHAKVFSAKDELRRQLNSLCIDIPDGGQECYFVATNSRILVKHTYTAQDGVEYQNGVKGYTFKILNSFFKCLSAFNGCERIVLESDDHYYRLVADDIEFICVTLNIAYPAYNAILPKDNPYYITFNKTEMLDSLRRVGIFGDADSQLIVLRKNDDGISLEASNNNISTSSTEEVFINDANCINNYAIGLNTTFLANSLSAIDSDIVRMQFSEPYRPCLFTSDTPSPRVLSLTMPMNIQ